jgi:hypothetical protein
MEDPRAALDEMLEFSDLVFLSTYVLPEPCPRPDEWWYYGLDHGQHISFFSLTALATLAAGVGARVYSDGLNHHLIARRPVSARRFSFALGKRAGLLAPFFKRKSLLQDDFAYSIQRQTDKAAS